MPFGNEHTPGMTLLGGTMFTSRLAPQGRESNDAAGGRKLEAINMEIAGCGGFGNKVGSNV